MPTLLKAFPDAEAALCAAARQAAQARALIAEVTRADLGAIVEERGLVISRWAALSEPRRRESLKAWLSVQGIGEVRDSMLDRLVSEIGARATPATWALGAGVLTRYRGCLSVALVGAEPSSTLRVAKVASGGIPRALLTGARWLPRQGGEQFQRSAGTPPRSLKKQFQAAGVPAWSRSAPLLVASDGTLLFVPGIGIDARALAAPGTPRVSLEWVTDR
jgi:tRNA(Ile)-lysidine synthase